MIGVHSSISIMKEYIFLKDIYFISIINIEVSKTFHLLRLCVEVSNEIDGTIIEYSGFFAYPPLTSISKQ